MKERTTPRSCRCGLLAAVALLAFGFPAAAQPPAGVPEYHAPLGPHIHLTEAAFDRSTSYTPADRLVLTPYFYWYDVYSGAHLINPDGSDALTDHPPTTTGFSYRSQEWHRQQLLDAEEAGIDVLLPVFWGEPSQRLDGKPVADHPWSYAGIPPLLNARDQLEAEGRRPPRLGLFYDTSTLQFHGAGERIDLTTPAGRQWFYETVRDFYSLVAPRHWAMIDGHPIVFLYAAGFAARHDQSCLDFLKASFARDFAGRTPFVVREISWNLQADQVYAWGGALGLKNPGVASLGPGYDHSAVPGRDPLVVPRDHGAFFENNWLRFLRRPSSWVMIETWNEFHEGTEIAASREYGRDYIRLNRRYADLFKSGYQPPREIGPFTEATELDLHLSATNTASGLTQFDHADGLTQAAFLDGSDCRILSASPHASRYLYLSIDDSFKWAALMDIVVLVDCLDATPGTLQIEFDGSDPAAPFQGAYSPSAIARLHGTHSWRTVPFRLQGAKLLHSQNGGADLRLSAGTNALAVRRVRILREGLRGLHFHPDGGFTLQLTGIPGSDYTLFASDSLTRWEPLVRLRPSVAVSQYTDLTAPGVRARWYRWQGPALP